MRDYVDLTKPGVIVGNLAVAMAAFVFASHDATNWQLFAYMSMGLALVIGSACVFNNYFDREIDARMERTKNRALAAGRIPLSHALAFGAILFVSGAVLLLYTNVLALAVALAGFVVYVLLYTPLKHQSGYALFVGAIAGATPPVVGYVAAVNTLDSSALILFVVLYLWQLPHFVAIAVHRFAEYKAAGIPLIITREPSERTKRLARTVFYASLIILLLFCLILIVQR